MYRSFVCVCVCVCVCNIVVSQPGRDVLVAYGDRRNITFEMSPVATSASLVLRVVICVLCRGNREHGGGRSGHYSPL
jgi:hypothetical protein